MIDNYNKSNVPGTLLEIVESNPAFRFFVKVFVVTYIGVSIYVAYQNIIINNKKIKLLTNYEMYDITQNDTKDES